MVHLGDPCLSVDNTLTSSQKEHLQDEHSFSSVMEKNSFICEDLSVACDFGHDRYALL